ncbi:hypothetical protein FNO01nite_30210 [Flavobacterium noncentrifugens]|uniref:DUF3164 family protein n=1 Tax=Flavobacterium noncentrifugens TaxID=1128970 RepID=A0A1G9BS43_9FLAO|nr:hypothetical protein [Flavobacterium noncentrifugens]GEP52349.1 hypothetical protein FNO01nite_30210 [Flavobacterium noncentrifugens]SDK42318.1 hypothetical protein SAMN04487935_3333 [Flavobacterium noncentrifugens]
MSEILTKPDLNAVSTAELLAALEARKNEKQQNRTAYKELVTGAVSSGLFELCVISEELSKAKQKIFQRFEQILELKNEVYGIKEKQRSHTFTTEHAEIVIGYRINDGWDDTHTAGIEKVKKYLERLSVDEKTANLVNVVFNLLKLDSKGNLKGSRVLELQQFAEQQKDQELIDGVQIIAAAYRPVRSSWFVEASVINDGGKKVNIPLALSSVDFPAGYSFDFFSPEPLSDAKV